MNTSTLRWPGWLRPFTDILPFHWMGGVRGRGQHLAGSVVADLSAFSDEINGFIYMYKSIYLELCCLLHFSSEKCNRPNKSMMNFIFLGGEMWRYECLMEPFFFKLLNTRTCMKVCTAANPAGRCSAVQCSTHTASPSPPSPEASTAPWWARLPGSSWHPHFRAPRGCSLPVCPRAPAEAKIER